MTKKRPASKRKTVAGESKTAEQGTPVMRSARAVAAEVLHQFDPDQAYASSILNRLLNSTDEKQRATDLVFGTIRNLNAINQIIEVFSGRRLERISKTLLAVIRIGVYELAYNPETPPHSIVNEAVNTTKRMGGRKQTGFVNAVLRGIVRHIEQRQTEQTEANARRLLITDRPGYGICFDTDLLPDPLIEMASYLSLMFSLPLWLVQEWICAFGADRAREICLASNRRPSVYIRVNPIKTTGAALLQQLLEAGFQVEPVDCDHSDDNAYPMLKISGPQSVTQLPGFTQGLFTIQDVSASNAVRVLDPQPDWKILDLCAAPGTKTMQLAEMTRDKARIVASDINAKRLVRFDENLARLGFNSVTVVPYDELVTEGASADQSSNDSFDAILLDVPCSNTGVLARRIEVRFRITPASVSELATIQRGLLEKAAGMIKPGGRICYSTCSVQQVENGDLVRSFLKANPQFELTNEEMLLPSVTNFDCDGAYAAVITRKP